MVLIFNILIVIILLLVTIGAGHTIYERYHNSISDSSTMQRAGILFVGAFFLISMIELFKSYYV